MRAMDCAGFDLDGYYKLVDAFRAAGYRVASFHDANPNARDIILRHDIDLSLGLAVQMAEAEAAMGVFASYFVLVSTEQYNAGSAEGRTAIRRLGELGHEVGLHFDAGFDDPAAHDARARAEADFLSGIVGEPIRIVSFHRPARHLMDSDSLIGGMPHAYQRKFFSGMAYVSDSRGGWYHGHPLDHPAFTEGKAMQLLTHPIWWCGEPRRGTARLRDHSTQRQLLLDQDLSENVTLGPPSGRKQH